MHGSITEEIPPWVVRGEAVLMLGMVAVASFDADVPNRGLVVTLTVLATSGWWLCLVGIHLPLAVRAALAVGGVGALNLGASWLDLLQENPAVQVTLMITVYLAGEAVSHFPRGLAVATVIGCLAAAAAPFTWKDIEFDSGPVWLAGTGLAVLAGAILRALLITIADLHAAQEELAATAAADERRRIAREVHDVIAHSLTVTMLHLTAARLAVGRGDPTGATEALEEAERAGRRSLAEVRRTVGLLRTVDGGAEPAVAPSSPLAEDVSELIAGYRAAGLDVTLTIDGDLTTVDVHVGLALYRIVQESLANAARHTPGAHATVALTVADPVRIEVRSTGGRHAPDARGAGAGLLGMRERAEAIGGRCTSGPDGNGGWLVAAELPVGTVAAVTSR